MYVFVCVLVPICVTTEGFLVEGIVDCDFLSSKTDYQMEVRFDQAGSCSQHTLNADRRKHTQAQKTQAHSNTRKHIHINTDSPPAHTHIHTYTLTHIHTYTHTHAHKQTQTNTHTHKDTHTHKHTHTNEYKTRQTTAVFRILCYCSL